MERITRGAGPAAGAHRAPADDVRERWATQVESALAALDGLSRAALQLVYLHGMTQSQAAARLGVAESTVKTQVALALHQLSAGLLGGDTRHT